MSLPNCTICFENLDESKNVSVLECGHVFHYDCIKDWVEKCNASKQSPSCPTCQTIINWYAAKGVVFKAYLHQGDEQGNDAKPIAKLERNLTRQEDKRLRGNNKAGYTAQDAPSARLKITRDGRTDGPTDGRTETPSYRDATAHLKKSDSSFAEGK